jgi:DNA integrity scanning protein DisA with diadenylate cyclase activity
VTFLEELQAIEEVRDIDIRKDSMYLIEFYLSHSVLTEEAICMNFDDFDADKKEDQERILKVVGYLKQHLSEIMYEANEKLALYMIAKYKDEIDTTTDLLIERYNTFPTIITFSPELEFGTCCISFNSDLEIEHGFGVGLVDWKINQIGFEDICFSNFYE